jgi:hypothetical protein
MMAITISDVRIDPQPLVPGRPVKVTCRIESSEEIRHVQIYDPRDYVLKMYDDGTHGDAVAGDGVYTLTETVPYDAPAGSYSCTLIVRDAANNVERRSATIEVG